MNNEHNSKANKSDLDRNRTSENDETTLAEPLLGRNQAVADDATLAEAEATIAAPEEDSVVAPSDNTATGTCLETTSDSAQVHARSSTTLDCGQRLGSYQILQEIGAGGMGKVYKARHPGLDKIVAIKVMLGQGQVAKQAQERFVIEARLTAKLKHPNIVTVHDVAEENGMNYIVMDFIAGQPLSELLQQKAISAVQALHLMKKAAKAMAYAHDQGIVHRDLKPSNLFIESSSGEPIVVDFGIAKNIKMDSNMTQSGELLGTPRYMAPEQASGEIDKISPRTDIYALGAILYEMLTGVQAVEGEMSFNIIFNILQQDVIAPRKHNPKLAKDLETICLKALEKNPARRYQTAMLLAQDIERFLNAEMIMARPAPWWYRLGRKLYRHKVAIAAVLLSAIVYGVWSWHRTTAGIEKVLTQVQPKMQQFVNATYDEKIRLYEEIRSVLYQKGLVYGGHRIEQQIYQVEKMMGEFALQQENWLLSRLCLENCKRIRDDRHVQQLLQQLKNAREKKQKLLGRKAANVLRQSKQLLADKASLRRYMQMRTKLEQVLAIRRGNRKLLECLYRIDSEIGLLALVAQDNFLSTYSFQRCMQHINTLWAGKQRALTEKKQLDRRKRNAYKQLVRSQMQRLVSGTRNELVIRDCLTRLARIQSHHLWPILEKYLHNGNDQQREVALSALGNSLAAMQHSRIASDMQQKLQKWILQRLANLELQSNLAEAELLIATLAKWKAANAKHVVYKIRHQARQQKLSNDFLGKTFKAYCMLPLGDRQPETAGQWLQRGKIQAEQHQWKQAIRAYDQALQFRRKFVDAYYHRGIAHSAQQNFVDAIRDFTQAVQLNSHFEEAYLQRGIAHCQRENLQQAIRDFTRAISTNKMFAAAYYHRGCAFAQLGTNQRAIRDFVTAIKCQRNFVAAYNKLGLAYLTRRNFDKAFMILSKALQVAPQSATAYFYRGIAAMERGDKKTAIQDYTWAIYYQPRFAQAYSYRGITRMHLDDTRALADCNTAIKLLTAQNHTPYLLKTHKMTATMPLPKYTLATAHYHLGLVYQYLDKNQRALAEYTKAVQLHPQLASAYFQRGKIYQQLQKIQPAMKDYSRAIEVDPQYAPPFKTRGSLYARKLNHRNAVKDFRCYLQLRPDDAQANALRAYIRRHGAD